MPDLECLITDKFTINSGGKTPQRRRMESAAQCFSSRMCPTTLNFTGDGVAASPPSYNKTTLAHAVKSPLKSIENYIKKSPVTSRHSNWSHGANKGYLQLEGETSQSKIFGEDITSMEVFQSFNDTTQHMQHKNTWSDASCSSSNFAALDCESNCFANDKDNVFENLRSFPSGCDAVDGCSTRRASTLSGSCIDYEDGLDNLVPQCSRSSKMARLENKENFISMLSSSSSSHVLCDDVVRSPTRLDLSCLLSPSRRKTGHSNVRQDNRPTPSKFTMVRNSLNKSPSFAVPTPKKQPDVTSSLSLDYNSRDSGFEHSLSYEDKMTSVDLNVASRTDDTATMESSNSNITNMELSQCTLDITTFHDELTQAACHFDTTQKQQNIEGIYSSDTNIELCRINSKFSPLAGCSKQSDYGRQSPHDDKLRDLEEYEYETLHDLEEFDTSDVPPGSSMSKYEIISTDSPDITIARGTPSAVSRILADDFEFGSPIGDEERSENFGSIGLGTMQKSMGTLYGRIPMAMRSETTRMLNFDTPSPTCKRVDSNTSHTTSLQDGSVFKLAIEKLSCRSSRVMTYDSGLGAEEGGDEDTLLVLDELENNVEIQEHVQPASLLSLIHDTVIHKGKDEEERDVLPMEESSPLCLPLRRPAFRRCFSLNQSSQSSNQEDNNSLLYDSPKSGATEGFKRPELSRGTVTSLLGRKRRKQSAGDLLTSDGSQDCEMREEMFCTQIKNPRPALQRAMSDNEATIKMALTRSLEDTDLIGDFSAAYRLPVVRSQHSDLKVISPDTLASLMKGDYSKTVSSYQIIDCRYPFEYIGGHIEGARNLFTEELVHEALIAGQQPHSAGHILIFHCEFSMQRGPKLVRYLRCVDRALHRSSYPALHHPELYLLGGGYCLFSSKHPEHTVPRGSYITMLDPRHVEERKKYQVGKYKGKRGG